MGAKNGKSVKRTAHDRAKLRIRKDIARTAEGKPRLTVFRSSQHTYAQVVSSKDGSTIASASTLDKEVKALIAEVAAGQEKASQETAKGRNAIASSKSTNAARAVGLVMAKRGLAKDIKEVVFDRSGYKYCGRIKALADGAREGGFEF